MVNHGQGVDTQGPSMLSFNVDRSLILSEIPHDRCITVSDHFESDLYSITTTAALITRVRNGRGYRESSAERLY